MPEKQHCKICGGKRSSYRDGKVLRCEGCGMPVGNCHITNEQLQKTKSRLSCPQCRSPHAEHIELGRFSCSTCGTVYELPDHGFIDDRPEQNAMKKERQSESSVTRMLRHGT